jgi:hypothetical protein
VLTVSPVIGNMMRFQQQQLHHQNNNGHSGGGRGGDLLATKLFWQTDRFSPLQVSRNKSQPVAHLTPRFMGVLWQVAAGLVSEKEQKVSLQRAGIRSNHVQDEWTGVSMARWMDLLSSLQLEHRPTDPTTTTAIRHAFPPLVVAPWLAALWQIARTKDDLLDFLLAMEEYSTEESILDDTNELARALRHDENARKEWAASSFAAEEITPDRVHEALDQLVSLSDDVVVGGTHDSCGGRLMEVIAASRAIQHFAKPVVPNGRYGYDGGQPKSDCVEVAVREILDLLLWDESQACFDFSRWPRASQELVQLYQQHGRPVSDEGQLWFDVLSSRPGCDYLAVSPQGKPYELTPTMANVARVVQQLLGFDTETESGWTTLEELASTWNELANTPLLRVTSSKRTFRPPMSDQLVHEEHSTLSLEGSKYGISIKLDKKREFATVAHIRMRNDRVDDRLLTQLREKALRNPTDVTWALLCMAMMGDHGLYQQNAQPQSTSSHSEADVMALLMDLFAAPFGPDRRELMELAVTSDLEVEDRAHAQALRMSRDVLAQSVARVCGEPNLEESLRQDLLGWLLHESPCVVPDHASNHLSYDPRVEGELLKLSPALLDRLPLSSSIWACRDGAALAQVVKYQRGQQSSRDLLFQDLHGNTSSPVSLITKLLYYTKLRGA